MPTAAADDLQFPLRGFFTANRTGGPGTGSHPVPSADSLRSYATHLRVQELLVDGFFYEIGGTEVPTGDLLKTKRDHTKQHGRRDGKGTLDKLKKQKRDKENKPQLGI